MSEQWYRVLPEYADDPEMDIAVSMALDLMQGVEPDYTAAKIVLHDILTEAGIEHLFVNSGLVVDAALKGDSDG